MWDEGYVDKLKLSSRKKNYGKHNLLINKLKKYIYTIIIQNLKKKNNFN